MKTPQNSTKLVEANIGTNAHNKTGLYQIPTIVQLQVVEATPMDTGKKPRINMKTEPSIHHSTKLVSHVNAANTSSGHFI